jgi:hypothetical protein
VHTSQNRLAQPLGLVAQLNENRGAESGSPTAAGRQQWWGIPASRHRRWVGERCYGRVAVWWTNLRGKGTGTSLNGALYDGGSPGGGEPTAGARTGGRGSRRLGRGAARRYIRARGWASWAGEWAEGWR